MNYRRIVRELIAEVRRLRDEYDARDAEADSYRTCLAIDLAMLEGNQTITLGTREVYLSPDPAAEREAEIARLTDEDGHAQVPTLTGLGAVALAACAGLLALTCLVRPLLPVPACEMPATVSPVAVLGGQRVVCTWYRGDQIAPWQRSVAAELELFGVAGQEVAESEHAVRKHAFEAVIARMAAQELCPASFWDQPPCDDGRYRWVGQVPNWSGVLSPYAGRWAVVVVDAAGMTEVTSFLADDGPAGEVYLRNVHQRCHDGSLRPAG